MIEQTRQICQCDTRNRIIILPRARVYTLTPTKQTLDLSRRVFLHFKSCYLPTLFEASPPDIELTPLVAAVHDHTVKHTVHLTICTPRPLVLTTTAPRFIITPHHVLGSSKDTGTIPCLVIRESGTRTLGADSSILHKLFTSRAVHVDAINALRCVEALEPL
jgi:hypothetical protein